MAAFFSLFTFLFSLLFYTFAQQNNETMEKQQEDTLMKVRSFRSILAAAFRLYTSRFLALLKSQWIHLLDTSIVTAAVAMFVVYDLYLFIPLAAVAVLLELVLWLMTARWLTQRPLRSLFRMAKRHWLLLIGVVLSGVIVLSPLYAFVTLPAAVLTLAEWESQQGVMIGDPQTMPAYSLYLAAVTWLITAFLQLCIRLYIVFVAYYACGSAETRQREREEQVRSLSSTL